MTPRRGIASSPRIDDALLPTQRGHQQPRNLNRRHRRLHGPSEGRCAHGAMMPPLRSRERSNAQSEGF
jgi:hypothetical protein